MPPRDAHVTVMRWLRALTLRTGPLFAIAMLASVAFVIIAAEVRAGALDHLDVTVELAIHRLDSRALDVVMMAATVVGSNVVLVPAVVLVALLALRQGRRQASVILAVDAVAVLGLDQLVKAIFARERPQLFDKIALPTDYSFPSGHSMSAMGIYGVIAAVVIALHPRSRTPVLVATIALVAMIGLSRIYLGVHWPSDVLGGFLGGVAPLAVSVHVLHRGIT